MNKCFGSTIKGLFTRFPLSLPAVLCIAFASLFPIPEVKLMQDVALADKWAHFIMYSGLACAVWIDIIRQHNKLSTRSTLLLTVLLPIAIGGLLELAQAHLTTCRSGEWLDFAANSIGVLIALPIGFALKKIFGA